MSTNNNALHWFRKGIRLHDNPALVEACKHRRLFAVYCLDPHFSNVAIVGQNRYRFLLESLRELDANLRSLGSRLFVLRGKPHETLIQFSIDNNVHVVTFERDTEPYAIKRDKEVTELLKGHGIQTSAYASHMLRDPEEYIQTCAQRGVGVPSSYGAFCKLFDSLGPLRSELAAPESLPSFLSTTASSGVEQDQILSSALYDVPTLTDMGYAEEKTAFTLAGGPFVGGEREALRRLEATVTAKNREQWVRSFEKPNTAPNSLSPSTTVLSPYLKFGCLSANTFYRALDRVVARGRRTEPPVSLHGQLLWREFFYLSSFTTPNFDRMEGNPQCRQIPWGRDAALIDAWKFGRTGYPFIDAIMTQLRVEGWIHHLARHAVACFLTRGDLYQHWEEGVRVFDLWLLDSDWALNNANWQWLSCSNFFYQYFRVYSPVAFGKKTDPEGLYIKKWIPQLAKYPAKYIYSPWEASAAQQQQWGCVVGQDYPEPIVEHAAASKECMRRMQLAYAQHKQQNVDGDAYAQQDDESGHGVSSSGRSTSKKETVGGKRKKAAASSDQGSAKQGKISSYFTPGQPNNDSGGEK
mmetsp:Transcript_64781/g.114346  ORF Transcript_64781/g.114346 Transcript_64781/m.114346 type:complete len:580 (-) Transcript_64781:875-2614(-)|eukprot:CAMPEP_0185013490 /NCGR_PEP_ID=MMETSP1098-20130426/98829_1 /TAXON_ID=89044 /ORGANISM="Spumella elongata, Strain CCAP 955/1" /LENGTH=579 /DNA_ID=CAMNT_0027542557 /DNA_START=166 /DNA_END=1905 /DNA_ORIENTATION=-